jgi:hypothetical protein
MAWATVALLVVIVAGAPPMMLMLMLEVAVDGKGVHDRSTDPFKAQ